MKTLEAIPGFGEYKARLTIGVLVRQYGVKPSGYAYFLSDWPSIVEMEKPEDLADLKERKKVWKAEQKA